MPYKGHFLPYSLIPEKWLSLKDWLTEPTRNLLEECAVQGSNLRLLACEASALPLS